MCTIVLAHRYVRDVPIVVGVNRDERYDRPAHPPAEIEGSPAVLAPMDLEAGGTWVGVNEHGLVAAIANRPGGPDGDRSRGWLVRTALRCPSATVARDRLQAEFEHRTYAGCYVLVADADDAFLLAWDGTQETWGVEPGVHVVVNAGLNEPAKADRVRSALLQPSSSGRSAWIPCLRQLMRDHDRGTCVHHAGAGTRSSSIITVAPHAITYEFSDGPPCIAPYKPIAKWER